MLKHIPVLALTVMLSVVSVQAQCDYDYLHRLIEAIVKLEIENTNRKTEVEDLQASIEDTVQTIKELNTAIPELKTQEFFDSSHGSTYVRWGNKTCPGEDSVKVYDGFTGGSNHADRGSGSNLLCLPKDPVFRQGVYDLSYTSKIYGAQYAYNTEPAYNHEIPCAVCWIPRSSNLMIPARNECYPGWRLEYQGLLAGERFDHQRLEYVCIDESEEFTDTSSASNEDGTRLYHVVAQCGTLPCDDFQRDGSILTCAVCSYSPSTDHVEDTADQPCNKTSNP